MQVHNRHTIETIFNKGHFTAATKDKILSNSVMQWGLGHLRSVTS